MLKNTEDKNCQINQLALASHQVKVEPKKEQIKLSAYKKKKQTPHEEY